MIFQKYGQEVHTRALSLLHINQQHNLFILPICIFFLYVVRLTHYIKALLHILHFFNFMSEFQHKRDLFDHNQSISETDNNLKTWFDSEEKT